MDSFEEKLCRLCLRTVSDELFKEIEDDTKSALGVLLLKLNLDNSSKDVMCNICSQRVIEAFRFKSMCLHTDNTIISYLADETSSIDFKEIYRREAEKKHVTPTLGNYKICRLCLQIVGNKVMPVQEMPIDVIGMYIPEINLNILEDPVICKQCFDSFVTHSSFIKDCLEVDKKIKSLCNTDIVNDLDWKPSIDSYIKTEEMDIKSENKEGDEWLETYPAQSNRNIHREIKAEDEEEKSEAAHVTDTILMGSVNRCNPSQDNKYSTTDCTSTRSHHPISYEEPLNTNILRNTCDSSSKQKCSIKRDLPRHKYNSGREELRCGAHDTRTEIECDTCNFKTKHKYRLKLHQLTHKDISEVEVFDCDGCSYKTKYKFRLKQHQLVHRDMSEIKAFECDKCDYKTKFKNNLKMHLLTHKNISEVKVFVCDTCNFKTKYKGCYKQHQLTHKDMSETELFECDACSYVTKLKGNLKKHRLIHKGLSEAEVFVCDKCGFKTKYRNSLKGHQLKHRDISETEVFECGTCDYKSKQKSNLRRHLLTHKNVSKAVVFECDRCSYTCKRKGNLKKHQLLHKDIPETEVFQM